MENSVLGFATDTRPERLCKPGIPECSFLKGPLLLQDSCQPWDLGPGTWDRASVGPGTIPIALEAAEAQSRASMPGGPAGCHCLGASLRCPP